jgi:hypothetical protein
VAAGDRVIDIARDLDAVLRLCARVASQREIVNRDRNRDLAREIGQEKRDALENADQHYRLAPIVARDPAGERAYARLQLNR